MKAFTYSRLHNYKNNGQDIEQSIRFTLTGEITKADNIRYDIAADVLNYQIKSARATVCKGTDLQAYLNMDASSAYIYGTKNGTAYIMTKDEYITFITLFGTITQDSKKNGGQLKIRLKDESKAMLEWFKINS